MFKNMIKRAALAFTALALLVPAAAFASDGTTALVTAGTLTITNPQVSTFTDATITNAVQTTDADLDAFSVSDLTGSGAGWHVTAQATLFTRTPTGHNLSLGSLEMSEPGVAAHAGTTSADPTVATGPYIIDAVTAVQIASAATDTGMGVYDFDATTLTLHLPALLYAGSYASTVTISSITAP